MKLLDKYILTRFLLTYLFVVIVIVLVVCMIDYTEKVDDFHHHNAPASKILINYYLNFIPYWANYISPLMVFIATVFMTSRLAAKSEVIAILSSGVSFVRLMLPYFIGSLFLVGWIIPRANKIRIAFELQYVKDQFTYNGRNVHLKVGEDTYAYLESYNNQLNTGYKFTLEQIKGNKLVQKLSSDRIEWSPEKKKWVVYDYNIRKFDGLQETLTRGQKLDTLLNLYPSDFDNKHSLYETFTFPELDQYIALLSSRGSDGVETYLLEKYSRQTRPFAIIILTAIGVIMSARKSRRGVGWQLALGFILAFVYLLFFMMAKGIAESGNLNPIIAVWLPNLIFTGIGLLLYHTIPR